MVELGATFGLPVQHDGGKSTGYSGIVNRVWPHFGFIASDDFSTDVHFNRSSLVDISKWASITLGGAVTFNIESRSRGPHAVEMTLG